jgi:starch phosphorylase
MPIVDSLINHDTYMILADFAAYCQCQEAVDEEFRNPDQWTRKSIINAAHMGKFSSDRAICEYANEIWGVKSI